MKLRKSARVFGVVAVLLSSSLGFAQDGPPRFLQVQTFTVVPGMIGQFEGVVRQVNEAFKQTGAAPQISLTFGTVAGGDFRTYYFATPFNEQSDRDAWRNLQDVLVEAYGQEEAIKILTAGDASIRSLETRISITQVNAASLAGGIPTEFPALATVVRTEVDPALIGDYTLFQTKLKEAEVAAGVQWLRQRTIRGPLNLFTANRSHDTHGDTVPLPGSLLRDHFGAAEAEALMQRQRAAVVSREILTLGHRPDLSRMPGN